MGPATPVAFRVLGPDGHPVTDYTVSHDEDLHLIADFTAAGDGENRTLGADLAVAGEYAPAPLPEPSRTAEVDGYTVTLDGDLVPARSPS